MEFKSVVEYVPLLLQISLLERFCGIVNIDPGVLDPDCLSGETNDPLDIDFFLIYRIVKNHDIAAFGL
jgi:hypothetical protein